MPFRDTIREYRRAADHRLADARELLEVPTWESQRSDANQRHLRGAMYLAGYAVECLLKAYLIQQMNTQTLGQAMDIIDARRVRQGKEPVKNIARTAAGHRIAYLVQLTDLETACPGFDVKLWGRVGMWQSSWRYESDQVRREVAQDFFNDVQSVVDWLSSKLGG